MKLLDIFEALNLYKLHSKPEELKGHHETQSRLKGQCEWATIALSDPDVGAIDFKQGRCTVEDLVPEFDLSYPDEDGFPNQAQNFNNQVLQKYLKRWREYFQSKRALDNFNRAIQEALARTMQIHPKSFIDCFDAGTGEEMFLICSADPAIITMAIELADNEH